MTVSVDRSRLGGKLVTHTEYLVTFFLYKLTAFLPSTRAFYDYMNVPYVPIFPLTSFSRMGSAVISADWAVSVDFWKANRGARYFPVM